MQATDLAAFLAYRSDPLVARYQSWDAMDEEEARGFLAHCASITPLIRPGHWIQVAVADSRSDALLGDMGWHLSNDGGEIELGITLARHAQGLGHATRAVEAAVRHLFDATQAARIVGFADLRNLPSRALLRRTGFTSLGEQTYEGVREEAFEFRRPGAQG
jgi:aminoglycoside 6'-N-acetyltransferase